MNKNIILAVLVILVLLVVGGVLWLKPSSAPSPAAENSSKNMSLDETASINEELNAIDVGNVDADFTDVDTDVSSL